MNHISKIHQRFSDHLRNPRFLDNPEEFLGPNYKEVLNFWLIIEDLSEEQLRVVQECYWAFFNENFSEWVKAKDLDFNASREVVSENYAYNASLAASEVIGYMVAGLATRELIGMHKILENHQQPLTFVPMFLEVL